MLFKRTDMKLAGIFTLLFLMTYSPVSLGQTGDSFNVLSDNIEDRLPKLNTLIDSAIAHDSYVQFRRLQVDVNTYKLQETKNQWQRNLGIQTDIRYGTFDNFSVNESNGQTPSTFATTRSEMKYGYAAYIKFPLYDIATRKIQKKLAMAEVDQAVSMAQNQADETRRKVIQQYNQLILAHRLLKIKSKYLETARINQQMTEKEFVNGVIPVTEYSRISEIVTRAEADYESANMDFRTAYMMLEDLAGFKFNLVTTGN